MKKIKEKINLKPTISMKEACKFNLDMEDLLIISYIDFLRKTNKNFILDKFIEDFPIISNSKTDIQHKKLRIKRRINKLINKGLLINNTNINIKEIVLKLKNTGSVCEWCGYKTQAIQYHHYPIPKSKGGTKTVKICPNCHYEYHQLVRENIELSPKYDEIKTNKKFFNFKNTNEKGGAN